MIYIVEDDSAIRELEQYALQSNGYESQQRDCPGFTPDSLLIRIEE